MDHDSKFMWWWSIVMGSHPADLAPMMSTWDSAVGALGFFAQLTINYEYV